MTDEQTIRLDTLNALDADAFEALLGGIVEHSPWVARGAWAQRPFATRAQLQAAMAAVLDAAPAEAQLAVLRAHPELAGRAAVANTLTADSRAEQSGAGLDRCTPEEFECIRRGNDAYGKAFGFPFIIAVKGLTRSDIIAALASRLQNDAATERQEALRQVHRIAAFRLAQKLVDAD